MNRFKLWLRDRLNTQYQEHLLHRYRGIQECPWCKQIAQSQPGWGFKTWEADPFLDVLTCGVCKGTSLWRFELGMFWMGALDPPPVPAPVHYYDIEEAKSRFLGTSPSPYVVMPVPVTLSIARKAWEAAYPILQAIANWERQHGTAACLMPAEQQDFLKMLSKGLIHGSARGAITIAAQPASPKVAK